MEFLHFLSQFRTDGGDIFFQLITYTAQELFVVGIICWLFWCSNKRLAYTLGFSYFTSGLSPAGKGRGFDARVGGESDLVL